MSNTEQPPATESERPEAPSRILMDDLSRISSGFGDLARDAVALLKAESRLAASALVLIVVLTIVTGFLLAGATLLLVAAPVVVLIEMGWLGPSLAVLAVVVMLLLMSLFLLWVVSRLGRDLLFPRSRAAWRQRPGQPLPPADERE
ncbi:phage holin family protein [Alcanivorax sp. 1008]|uniref:phage holin family protein n=1 Tax=Alcanivorax sp. 1008 TaxID=2816853 RepID=UPI001DDB2B2B|nr:phage holin family protein [Alcanivorax sp. 1008]MCC1497234.1 phage holin family protein [Alcanivorax sp. 1008]